jgi:hypothetical protein
MKTPHRRCCRSRAVPLAFVAACGVSDLQRPHSVTQEADSFQSKVSRQRSRLSVGLLVISKQENRDLCPLQERADRGSVSGNEVSGSTRPWIPGRVDRV